jgi:hypothetical protein
MGKKKVHKRKIRGEGRGNASSLKELTEKKKKKKT